MMTLIDNYFTNLKNTIDNIDKNDIIKVVNVLNNVKKTGGTIFIMGNGGSASTASHFACDINKGVSYSKKERFKVICLNDNIPTMLAYANDVSYEDIFVEQLKNFANPLDVVIGISGSGNSENILRAIKYANNIGCITVGLTGYNGGKLKSISNHSINSDCDDMQISEDMHMILVHLIMKGLSNIDQ